NEVGMRNHGVGGLVFAGVVVNAGGFFAGAALAVAFADDGVDDVVAGGIEQRLVGVGNQAFVAAVAVDDEDFLASVARHFVGGFLEEFELEVAAVGDSAGFVLGFENLAEIIFGEDDGEFLCGSVKCGVADVEEIGAERKMGAM